MPTRLSFGVGLVAGQAEPGVVEADRQPRSDADREDRPGSPSTRRSIAISSSSSSGGRSLVCATPGGRRRSPPGRPPGRNSGPRTRPRRRRGRPISSDRRRRTRPADAHRRPRRRRPARRRSTAKCSSGRLPERLGRLAPPAGRSARPAAATDSAVAAPIWRPASRWLPVHPDHLDLPRRGRAIRHTRSLKMAWISSFFAEHVERGQPAVRHVAVADQHGGRPAQPLGAQRRRGERRRHREEQDRAASPW